MTEPTVTQAWSAVMGALRAIAKGEQSEGKGSHKFSFRGIDTVMNAVGPVLREHKVIVFPISVEAKHRDYLDKSDRTVHEAIVTVGYRVVGPAGDHFDGMSIGESSDYSDKATTQAMSVAYRTFLLQSLTMPTDEPDPDLAHFDRATPDPMVDLGWESREVAEAEWKRLGALARELPDPAAVRDWFRANIGEFAKFTPGLARQWGEEIGAAEVKPTRDFDSDAAWATLEDKKAKLPAKRQAEIDAWMAERGIAPETLTREQASEAWTEMESTPSTVKEQGWRSRAERERTWASLTERIEALVGHPQHEVIVTAIREDNITEERFTKEQAEDILSLVATAEASR